MMYKKNIFNSKLCARTDGINDYAKSPSFQDVVSIDSSGLFTDSSHNFHHAFRPKKSHTFFTKAVAPRNLSGRTTASGVPRNFFRGGSTNSVEDRGQRERGSGGGSPLVRGSGGSCNLVQEI